MTKHDVKQELCSLSSEVADYFHCRFPADCFCGEKNDVGFQFSEKVLDFMKSAVREKINRGGF